MPFTLKTSLTDNYLRCQAVGDLATHEIPAFIDAASVAVRDSAREKLLVDVLDFKGKMDDVDRHTAGKHVASVFGHRIKVAVLMPANQITKMAELTATNRGARLLVTCSEPEAIKWLTA